LRWAVVLVLAGCFAKPEEPGPRDGAEPYSDCSAVPFVGDAATFSEFSATSVADPSLSSDGLEMYFTTDPDPGAMTYLNDIARWSRSSTTQLFTPDLTALPFNSPFADADPSLTADGSMIFFTSRRDGSERGFFATRVNEQWSQAQAIPGLETIDMHSLDISPDGLTLYFTDTSSTPRLLMATRSATDVPFAPDATIVAMNVRFPTVSADHRELFFNGAGTQHAVRASKDVPFQDPMPAPSILGVGPDLSADGQTLVLAVAGTLGVMRRNCPGL